MGIRPIVSSVNSVTENISSFVDGWLNPLVQKLPSYIKDSMEFIKLITTTQVPKDSILVSIDVSSLYTNIPHKDGIEACIGALKNDIDPDPLRPPIEIIQEMLNIVLKKQCDRIQWGIFSTITRHSHGHQNGTSLCQPVHGNPRTHPHKPES